MPVRVRALVFTRVRALVYNGISTYPSIRFLGFPFSTVTSKEKKTVLLLNDTNHRSGK
jgi:hypothetical protein